MEYAHGMIPCTPRTGRWSKLWAGCLAVGLSGALAAAVPAPPKNLIELHKNASTATNKQCLACHPNILRDKTSNPNFRTFHRVHLQSKLATPKKCSDCHVSVDLREGSAGNLRKQVEPSICAGCHDGNMPGAKKLYGS